MELQHYPDLDKFTLVFLALLYELHRIYLSENALKRGYYLPHLLEKSLKKGLLFATKSREKGQLEKLPDKHGYTWTPRDEPPGLFHDYFLYSLQANLLKVWCVVYIVKGQNIQKSQNCCLAFELRITVM